MRCFIFSAGPSSFTDICGTTVLNDLAMHIRRSGIEEIYTDSESASPLAVRKEFAEVRHLFTNDWIAALDGTLTRQSPLDLKKKGAGAGARRALSLACTGKPWDHMTVETDHIGFIQRAELNPSPENAATNLCFSGLAWIGEGGFDPDNPPAGESTAGFLLPGYWKTLTGTENYLVACHEILKGIVEPWPHLRVPSSGRIINSPLPEDCVTKGTLWLGYDCSVEHGCVLENCVIMNGSSVGSFCELRNCLVQPGGSVASGTSRTDKYLTTLGENDG